MRIALPSLCSLFFFSRAFANNTPARGFPDGKVYGVNLGSWLLVEPWMLPAEWQSMGGQLCQSDCSSCIMSEFDLVKAHPETADKTFNDHWNSWFTQDDVNQLVSLGINTVRIPLGYWIVEPLVNRSTEFYPRGGIKQLKRGLKQLKAADINVILDHHALPGVASPNQMFAGRCTTDVQFYTPQNYHRALVWTAVMTALSHIDSDFGSVFSIQAINEQIQDASKTPGYGEFTKNFVKVVRAVESSLGIFVDTSPFPVLSNANATASLLDAASNLKGAGEVAKALADAAPILVRLASQLGIGKMLVTERVNRQPLVTNFMDIGWQHNNPENPADAAIGPQAYDNHLYYFFGGVADANPDAYMRHLCNLDRLKADAAKGNTPLWEGEWSLGTQFNATDDFMKQFADAQKFMYGKGAGWIFWNFKIEISDLATVSRQWSYFEGVKRGFLTKDPSHYHNPNVCDPYIKA